MFRKLGNSSTEYGEWYGKQSVHVSVMVGITTRAGAMMKDGIMIKYRNHGKKQEIKL